MAKKTNIVAIRAKLASLAVFAQNGARKGYGLHVKHLAAAKALLDQLVRAGHECFIRVNPVNNSFVVIV